LEYWNEEPYLWAQRFHCFLAFYAAALLLLIVAHFDTE
jgi:hypothetical protein